MNVKLNNKGFSLVELMVVVAIIGILAAVAVPQFSKFQAKSRQSEAKASLAALYTAEKGFNAEYAGYGTAFQAIGYSPAGDVLYDVGFSTACPANWAGCAPNYAPGGVAPVAGNAGMTASAGTVCNAAGSATMSANGCRMKAAGSATAIGPTAVSAGLAVTTSTFTAEAAAFVYSGFATADRWRINQDKAVTQFAVGIP